MEINHSKLPFLAEERKFLSGPRSTLRNLIFTAKVAWNFIRGFRKMHSLGPCVTVFGSARFKDTNYYYLKAVEIGEALVLWKPPIKELFRQEGALSAAI